MATKTKKKTSKKGSLNRRVSKTLKKAGILPSRTMSMTEDDPQCFIICAMMSEKLSQLAMNNAQLEILAQQKLALETQNSQILSDLADLQQQYDNLGCTC